MKRFPLLQVVALLACGSAAVLAAPPPAAPAAVKADAAASAPSKLTPRPHTAAQAAEDAAAPGDLRPEKAVVPQLNIPLRRAAPAAGNPQRPSRNGIDDAAARCQAETSQRARDACNARVDAIPRLPR